MDEETSTIERKLYPAVCSDCGAETKVPFEPQEGRPVYCRDCYTKRRNFRGPRRNSRFSK